MASVAFRRFGAGPTPSAFVPRDLAFVLFAFYADSGGRPEKKGFFPHPDLRGSSLIHAKAGNIGAQVILAVPAKRGTKKKAYYKDRNAIESRLRGQILRVCAFFPRAGRFSAHFFEKNRKGALKDLDFAMSFRIFAIDSAS